MPSVPVELPNVVSYVLEAGRRERPRLDLQEATANAVTVGATVSRAATQTQLEQAMTRLLAGQPTASDGALTISSLCREADVGRDSYYRSPQQFKDTVAAAFARREAQQPELVALREEVAALKREKKHITQDNAHAVRELENTIRIYANRIQVLTVRNAELEDHLHQRAGHDVSVIRVGPAHAVTRP